MKSEILINFMGRYASKASIVIMGFVSVSFDFIRDQVRRIYEIVVAIAVICLNGHTIVLKIMWFKTGNPLDMGTW